MASMTESERLMYYRGMRMGVLLFAHPSAQPELLKTVRKLEHDAEREDLTARGYGGRPVCPKCRTTEGVHGGCDCGYMSPSLTDMSGDNMLTEREITDG